MKTIINADDFGIDLDRDLGIFWGVIKGYITSVSVIVTGNIGTIQKIIINLVKKKASIGIHINLTDNPLIKHNMEDLCNKKYNFERRKFVFWKNALLNELEYVKIKQEFDLQIEKFVEKFGFVPEHIDGHNHCNIFNKNIQKIFESFSQSKNIHLRIPYESFLYFNMKLLKNNVFFDDFYDYYDKEYEIDSIVENLDCFTKYDMILNNYLCTKNCNKDNIFYIGTMYGYYRDSKVLYEQLTKFKANDIVQIMTHPGFFFKKISHNSKFSNYDRLEELKSLKKLKTMLKKSNIKYINYKKSPGMEE